MPEGSATDPPELWVLLNRGQVVHTTPSTSAKPAPIGDEVLERYAPISRGRRVFTVERLDGDRELHAFEDLDERDRFAKDWMDQGIEVATGILPVRGQPLRR